MDGNKYKNILGRSRYTTSGELRFHPHYLSRIYFCLVIEKILGKVFGLRNLEVKVFG